MTIKSGTVKFAAGREFPNKFKPGEMQQNIVLTMEDGTEEKLYFKSGRVPHSTLKRGDSANILYEQMNGRTIRKLYADTSSNNNISNVPSSQPVQTNPVAQSAPKAVSSNSASEQVDLMLDAYVEIFDRVTKKFDEAGYPDLSLEDVRTISTSIMINLDRSNCDLNDLVGSKSVDEIIDESYDDDNDIF